MSNQIMEVDNMQASIHLEISNGEVRSHLEGKREDQIFTIIMAISADAQLREIFVTAIRNAFKMADLNILTEFGKEAINNG